MAKSDMCAATRKASSPVIRSTWADHLPSIDENIRKPKRSLGKATAAIGKEPGGQMQKVSRAPIAHRKSPVTLEMLKPVFLGAFRGFGDDQVPRLSAALTF